MTFKALLLTQTDGRTHAAITDVAEEQLPEADVTVAVEYSTLNYKDGLAITGRMPVVRTWPMIAGIDLAGHVIDSRSPDFQVGDPVLLNGYGLGETWWGGLAERARVKSEWLVRMPATLDARRAMIIGTAGYTAMLAVDALETHHVAKGGEVLVTGASGGVGSFSIALLSRLGYRVVAVSGRKENEGHLRQLGAAEILPRDEFSHPGKPLSRARWAGVIDSVGSHTLANACAATLPHGVVAACGNAGGMDFPSTVAPFILRGITLCGIDSAQAPMRARVRAWQRLADLVEPQWLDAIGHEIGLSSAIATAQELLDGRVTGRVAVKI